MVFSAVPRDNLRRSHKNTEFYETSVKKELHIPAENSVYGSIVYIVCSMFLSVMQHFLQGLTLLNQTRNKKKINACLSSARMTVENVFGIVARQAWLRSI